MQNFLVRVYDQPGQSCELVAMVPLIQNENQNLSDSELIAISMWILQDLERFSNAEIESFRYRLDILHPPDALALNSAPQQRDEEAPGLPPAQAEQKSVLRQQAY